MLFVVEIEIFVCVYGVCVYELCRKIRSRERGLYVCTSTPESFVNLPVRLVNFADAAPYNVIVYIPFNANLAIHNFITLINILEFYSDLQYFCDIKMALPFFL